MASNMNDISCKYPHLFSPIQMGNTLFRNRIFASPTGCGYHNYMDRPNDTMMAYYERKAIGGAASVCIGDATVDSKYALANATHIRLDDHGVFAHLNKESDLISRHGSVAAIELNHGGGSARISYHNGEKIYGAVASTNESFGKPIVAEPMPEEIIQRTIQKFADAAKFAKECGFGMVTLHGGHGWLLQQFMSPTNDRSDQWGGSFENRMRFPLAVVAAVREAVGPGFPLEIRISGSECYEGGYDISYGVEIAKALDGKVDLIHVSAGSHEVPSVFCITHPSMFLQDGVNVKYAAEIKKHVKFSKVATVGALSDPAMLEEIIASGKADVVELARGLICDPDLPIKARLGRDDEIVTCMRCLTCFSRLITKGQFCCALNPEICNETETKFAKPAAHKRNVLVAGGGIAGMQAALTCAKRGHQVTLCEKSGQLGGTLRCEETVPFKLHLKEYLDQQAKKVMQTPEIVVKLNTEVTPQLARKMTPDVIIAAMGARPFVPPIKGVDGKNVFGAEEIYRDPDKAGEQVVILGGGLVGTELSVFLSQLGRSCTVVEMAAELNSGGNVLHEQALRYEMEACKVTVMLSTKAVEVTEQGVVGESGGTKHLIPADTVITALGMKPLREESQQLNFCAPEFYQIGDCVTPTNIYQATNTAEYAALNIGRI